VTNGFSLPSQEDVFDYLVAQSIINIVHYDQNNSPSLTNELNDEWSDLMKDQIRVYIAEQQTQHDNRIAASPGTHGLTEQTIAKIGRKFHADYIIRGRLIEFKARNEYTWAPWKRGILPFIFGPLDPIFIGFSNFDQYDNINNMAAGGTIEHESNNNDNDFGLDFLNTEQKKRIDQAVVQMRIWVQEAATGNVIWTNRVDVKVSPNILGDKQYDALFNQAIEQASTSVIDNYITTVFHVQPVHFVPPEPKQDGCNPETDIGCTEQL